MNPPPHRTRPKPLKFTESIDLSVHLNVDPKKPNQTVQGTMGLPNKIPGKETRVLVIAESLDNSPEVGAVKELADGYGTEETCQKIADGSFGPLDYDKIVATNGILKYMKKTCGRVLGPRGLMPNLKMETVVDMKNMEDTINKLKAGSLSFKCDKFGVLNMSVGNVKMSEEEVAENIKHVLQGLELAKPEGVKSKKGGNYKYWKSVSINTTMGVGSSRCIVATCDPNAAYFWRIPQ